MYCLLYLAEKEILDSERNRGKRGRKMYLPLLFRSMFFVIVFEAVYSVEDGDKQGSKW